MRKKADFPRLGGGSFNEQVSLFTKILNCFGSFVCLFLFLAYFKYFIHLLEREREKKREYKQG